MAINVDLKNIDLSPKIGKKFAGESITYLGEQINQSFKKLMVKNRTNFDLYMSIELDIENTIVVDGSLVNGVNKIEAGAIQSENVNTNFDRLRLYLEGAGTIEVVLYK